MARVKKPFIGTMNEDQQGIVRTALIELFARLGVSGPDAVEVMLQLCGVCMQVGGLEPGEAQLNLMHDCWESAEKIYGDAN
jgi:hypothetical protein